MSLRTTKGKMIFRFLAIFVFHFIMRGISLVHAVAQFCLPGYKRKKKSVSSRAPLIDIDPLLKVNIKRNDAVAGWSLLNQVRVTHGDIVMITIAIKIMIMIIRIMIMKMTIYKQ